MTAFPIPHLCYRSSTCIRCASIFKKIKSNAVNAHERGAPIGEKRQWDSDDRKEADGHANIHKKMYEQDRNDGITVYPAKTAFLPFGQEYQADEIVP